MSSLLTLSGFHFYFYNGCIECTFAMQADTANYSAFLDMTHLMTNNKMTVRPTKTQISLGIRPV